ncbi:MAG: tetratricopeptide repeat protein [Candidatus Krumholzibacteriia bacterium]
MRQFALRFQRPVLLLALITLLVPAAALAAPAKDLQPNTLGAAAGVDPQAIVRRLPLTLTTAEGRAQIAADPRDPAGYIQVGLAALRSGDTAAAVKVLADGRAAAVPSAQLLVLLGAAWLTESRLADAEEATQAALALDPAIGGGQLQLGAIFARIGWPESALDCYEKALAQTPGDSIAQAALVYGLIGAGRAAQGEQECRRFLGSALDNEKLLIALGESLEAQEALKDAFNVYGRALVVDARSADAHARRGRLFCRFGQFDAAASECRAALAIDPSAALAHAYLGIAYAEQGQTEAAREHVLQAEAGGMRMDAVWGKLAQ